MRVHTHFDKAELMGLEALGEANGRGRGNSIEKRLVGLACSVKETTDGGSSGEIELYALDWQAG